jgi:hypothetical protein
MVLTVHNPDCVGDYIRQQLLSSPGINMYAHGRVPERAARSKKRALSGYNRNTRGQLSNSYSTRGVHILHDQSSKTRHVHEGVYPYSCFIFSSETITYYRSIHTVIYLLETVMCTITHVSHSRRKKELTRQFHFW